MRPSPSSPAVLRECAAFYEREAHALFSRSEDLMAMATEYFSKARELRNEAEDREDAEEAKQHWGAKVTVVRRTA